jgi:hypothetical protein
MLAAFKFERKSTTRSSVVYPSVSANVANREMSLLGQFQTWQPRNPTSVLLRSTEIARPAPAAVAGIGSVSQHLGDLPCQSGRAFMSGCQPTPTAPKLSTCARPSSETRPPPVRFHAKHVSIGESGGEYFQVSFDNEDPSDDDLDLSPPDQPCLLVQRQFELDDGGVPPMWGA